jgi:hypothetical protein
MSSDMQDLKKEAARVNWMYVFAKHFTGPRLCD